MALNCYKPDISLTSELLDFPDTFIDPFFQETESFLPANHLVQSEFDPFAYPNCLYNGGFFPNLAPDMLPEILAPPVACDFGKQNLVPNLLPDFCNVAPSGCDFGGKNFIPDLLPDFLNGVFFASPATDTLPDFLGTLTEILAPSGCDLLPDFLNDVFFASPTPDALPDFLGTPPEILDPAGCNFSRKKPTVTAQSIAARQRRRKISEKTQELGKLIPGGEKMNTAEMLQAAKKYVKFLQAQVIILETMESVQENEEMQILVTSSLVQEKLYSEEKCLVPKELLKTLAKNDHIGSNKLIKQEFGKFSLEK